MTKKKSVMPARAAGSLMTLKKLKIALESSSVDKAVASKTLARLQQRDAASLVDQKAKALMALYDNVVRSINETPAIQQVPVVWVMTVMSGVMNHFETQRVAKALSEIANPNKAVEYDAQVFAFLQRQAKDYELVDLAKRVTAVIEENRPSLSRRNAL